MKPLLAFFFRPAGDRVVSAAPKQGDTIIATRPIDAVVTRRIVCDRQALDKMLGDMRAKVAVWNAVAKP